MDDTSIQWTFLNPKDAIKDGFHVFQHTPGIPSSWNSPDVGAIANINVDPVVCHTGAGMKATGPGTPRLQKSTPTPSNPSTPSTAHTVPQIMLPPNSSTLNSLAGGSSIQVDIVLLKFVFLI